GKLGCDHGLCGESGVALLGIRCEFKRRARSPQQPQVHPKEAARALSSKRKGRSPYSSTSSSDRRRVITVSSQQQQK
ncbi:unnamed protein product, partial [Laminaria digitata]